MTTERKDDFFCLIEFELFEISDEIRCTYMNTSPDCFKFVFHRDFMKNDSSKMGVRSHL